MLSLLLVTSMVLLLTGVQVLMAQGAFRLSELTDRAEQLEVERDLLRLRLARLSSPDRVARAGGQVGLVLPEHVEILPSAPGPVWNPGSTSGDGLTASGP